MSLPSDKVKSVNVSQNISTTNSKRLAGSLPGPTFVQKRLIARRWVARHKFTSLAKTVASYLSPSIDPMVVSDWLSAKTNLATLTEVRIWSRGFQPQLRWSWDWQFLQRSSAPIPIWPLLIVQSARWLWWADAKWLQTAPKTMESCCSYRTLLPLFAGYRYGFLHALSSATLILMSTRGSNQMAYANAHRPHKWSVHLGRLRY